MLLFASLVLSAAHPTGQQRPTVSEDLKRLLASGARVRVIVQAEEGALASGRTRHSRGLRRQLAGALSLDLSQSEVSRLVADGGVAHISGDLPVVADMSITNKVTRADKVWAGSGGLIGLLGQPGVSGKGIGIAVIDSGIADHTAIAGRVVARVNLVGHEPNVSAIRSDTARTSPASSAGARRRPRCCSSSHSGRCTSVLSHSYFPCSSFHI